MTTDIFGYTRDELLSDSDIDAMHDEMLNDAYGPVQIAGGTYDAAEVLKLVDPTAYRCSQLNYIDRLLQDGIIVEERAPRTAATIG